MTEYDPLKMNILTKQAEDTRKSNSYGLITNLGGAKEKKPETAIVVSVGEFVTDIKVGDTLFFSRYAGIRIDVDNEEFLLLSRNEIFGKNPNKAKITMGETKDLLGIMENVGKMLEMD